MHIGVPQEHQIPPSESNAKSKCLVNDGTTSTEEAFKVVDDPSKNQPRVASTTDGPGDLLAMDILVAQACEEHRRQQRDAGPLSSAVFDRDFLTKWLLGWGLECVFNCSLDGVVLP